MLNVQRRCVAENHHLNDRRSEEKEARALIPEDLDEFFLQHLAQS
jgi:hypothetical protein